jgi:RNA polymerase-binding transcription factor
VLTAEQLEHYRTLLLQERAQAEERIGEREGQIPDTVREPGDPVDTADDAALLFQREELLIESRHDQELVARIDRALERIEEGTYGTSEVSGRPIPTERLEVVPWATTLPDEEPPEEEE